MLAVPPETQGPHRTRNDFRHARGRARPGHGWAAAGQEGYLLLPWNQVLEVHEELLLGELAVWQADQVVAESKPLVCCVRREVARFRDHHVVLCLHGRSAVLVWSWLWSRGTSHGRGSKCVHPVGVGRCRR